MGENLGMFRKGLVIIAVPFVFQMMFIITLVVSQYHNRIAQKWAIHTHQVIAQAEAMSRDLAEAQSALRGFVLTGDSRMTKPYERAVTRVLLAVGELQKFVDDNTLLQFPRAHALGRLIDQYLERLDTTYKLARAGRREEAIESIRDQDRLNLVEAIRNLTDQFLDEEKLLDRDRTTLQNQTYVRQNIAIGVGAVISTLIGVMMARAFSAGFTQRIAVVSENARRIAEGLPLASPLTGNDEISRLDASFHGMAKSLAEKDTENEMFIYSVSHDLRSPLVNLQGFAKELSLTVGDLRVALAQVPLPEKTGKRIALLLDHDMGTSIHFIQNAVTRLSSIIDSLLRLSRAGKVVLAKEPVDVQGVVGRVVEAISGTTAEGKIEMVVSTLPRALGDTTATEQVFANLVSNAVKYLDKARPGRIEVGAKLDLDGKMRTYYVKDNGLGIPSAYRSKLFLAFQRLHPGVAPGEGIGLALVRRMVERQGGKVWVDSEEGIGSTFFVTLPAVPTDLEMAAVNANDSRTDLRRK